MSVYKSKNIILVQIRQMRAKKAT